LGNLTIFWVPPLTEISVKGFSFGLRLDDVLNPSNLLFVLLFFEVLIISKDYILSY